MFYAPLPLVMVCIKLQSSLSYIRKVLLPRHITRLIIKIISKKVLRIHNIKHNVTQKVLVLEADTFPYYL